MLGRNRFTFEPLAIKEISFERESHRQAYLNERTALTAIPPHRNIVQFKGCYTSRRRAALVFEYIPYPSISQFLASNGPLKPREALYVTRQIVPSYFLSAFPSFGVILPFRSPGRQTSSFPLLNFTLFTFPAILTP